MTPRLSSVLPLVSALAIALPAAADVVPPRTVQPVPVTRPASEQARPAAPATTSTTPPAAATAPASRPAPAAAAALTAAAPVAPAPELERLKFLAGVFACEASGPARPGAPEAHWNGRFSGKLDLGGHFITFQYADIRAPQRPLPANAFGFFGWDRGLRRYLLSFADSNGVGFQLRADVPSVDQFEFKGTATVIQARHLPASYTVTRTVKGFDLWADATDGDGQLVRQLQLACARAARN